MNVKLGPASLISLTPLGIVRLSTYAPGATSTVSPGVAAESAAWIVAYLEGTRRTAPSDHEASNVHASASKIAKAIDERFIASPPEGSSNKPAQTAPFGDAERHRLPVVIYC
jgi:hypothetical protein